MKRNTTIAILKAIAIILMVVGHAEAPELLTNAAVFHGCRIFL